MSGRISELDAIREDLELHMDRGHTIDLIETVDDDGEIWVDIVCSVCVDALPILSCSLEFADQLEAALTAAGFKFAHFDEN